MKVDQLSSASVEPKIVHAMLKSWGKFTCLELGGAMGTFPACPLQGLTKWGIRISGNPHKHTVQWPSEALYIDKLLQELTQYKPKWAKALKYYYTEPGDIRLQAQALNLAKSTYHDQLQKGREWIERKLSTLH